MITIKEEFLGDDKTKRAIKAGGYEILALWLAMKGYAAEHGTDGFVPDEDIDHLPGAPPRPRKALKALVECGRLQPDGTRKAGLVDPATLGWQLHDYLDHASSSDELELRRVKAREQKRKRREELRRLADEEVEKSLRSADSVRRVSGRNAGQPPDKSPDSPDNSHARAGTGAGARGRTRDPSPAQPSQNDEEADNARARVPCPADLELTDGQRGSLLTNGIQAEIIARVTADFRGRYQDGSDPRTLEQWRRGLYTAVSNASNARSTPRSGARPVPFDAIKWANDEAAKEAAAGGETS